MTNGSAPNCLVAGFSMFPLLRSGDRVFLRPAERNGIVPGDIIVFSRGGKQGTPFLPPQGPRQSQAAVFCTSFERNGAVMPLTCGEAGVEEFHRNQKKLRQRERLQKGARTLCRLLPFKLKADHLEQALFGELRVFYWRKRPVAYENAGRWHWLDLRCACFIKPAFRMTLVEKELQEILDERL